MKLMSKNRQTCLEEKVSEHANSWRGWVNAARKGHRVKRRERRDCWINVKGKMFPCKAICHDGHIKPESNLGPAPFAPKSGHPDAPRGPGRPLEHGEVLKTVGVKLTAAQIAKAEARNKGVSGGVREIVNEAK